MQQLFCDVAVIGAGPAGMIAAGTAARQDAKVILIEKNSKPGQKLLTTGKGRSNIAAQEEDPHRFVQAFGKKGKFLYSLLSQFGVSDTLKFFHHMGMKTKVERGGRIFPASGRAGDVLSCLTSYLKEHNVKILYDSKVISFKQKGNKIESIDSENSTIYAKNFILATGGLSYPESGSSGEGYIFAKQLGHTIAPLKPALVPIIIKEPWIKNLQGLSLKNVKISVLENNKKRDERFGEALFTHFGMSGPIILDMSKMIGGLLPSPVTLQIDLKPALNFKVLDQRIQRDFQGSHQFKNILKGLLPQKIIPEIIRLSGIPHSKKVNQISKSERKKLVHLLKELKLSVAGLLGYEKAIITSGGVALKEIEAKTMRSKIISNLYFAGEIIDLDGPTGGYNLQVCWSSGYVAGLNASKG